MKRRGVDTAKLRRTLKKTRGGFSESVYGGSLIYAKLLILWGLVMIADFLFGIRFEYLWPFWLLIRSIYDSFRYQGVAFSVFFVCVTVTSDLICFLFIPVQLLFFLASTYVWVQYVWHADRGLCLPTASLWLLFIYVEASIRLKEVSASKSFTVDLCRPFAAHCIGYPVVTLGFGVKSYVSYKLRLRRQREVGKENSIFQQLLTEALPAQWPAIEADEADNTTTQQSVQSIRGVGDFEVGTEEISFPNGTPSSNGAPPYWFDMSSISNNKQRHRSQHETNGDLRYSSAAAIEPNVGALQSSSCWYSSLWKLFIGFLGLQGYKNSKTAHLGASESPDSSAQPSDDDDLIDDDMDKESSRGSDIYGHHPPSQSGNGSEILRSGKKGPRAKALSARRPRTGSNAPPPKTLAPTTPMKEDLADDDNTSTQLLSADGLDSQRKRNSSEARPPASDKENNNSFCLNCAGLIQREAAELDRVRSELKVSRGQEQDLKQQVQQLNSTLKSLKQETQPTWKQKTEQLETKLQNLTRARDQDRQSVQTLEKRLIEEQKLKQQLEQQLQQEKKSVKKAEEAAAAKALQGSQSIAPIKIECGEGCKSRKRELEQEGKQLLRELRAREDRIGQLETELVGLRQFKEAHNSEVLMSALTTMRKENAYLEQSLSSENRLKQELFSALGDLKSKLEFTQNELRSKDVEIEHLRAKLGGGMSITPPPPAPSLGTSQAPQMCETNVEMLSSALASAVFMQQSGKRSAAGLDGLPSPHSTILDPLTGVTRSTPPTIYTPRTTN